VPVVQCSAESVDGSVCETEGEVVRPAAHVPGTCVPVSTAVTRDRGRPSQLGKTEISLLAIQQGHIHQHRTDLIHWNLCMR
jgi:hypothetical protein